MGRYAKDFGTIELRVYNESHTRELTKALTALAEERRQILADKHLGWELKATQKHAVITALTLLMKMDDKRAFIADLQLRVRAQIRSPLTRDQQAQVMQEVADIVATTWNVANPRRRKSIKTA